MTTIDPAARKAAEAAVKAAEKKHAAAEKKSSAMREKYLELQAATNRAARELVAARVNPDLFDDDPTTVIEPLRMVTFQPAPGPVPIPDKVVDDIKAGAPVVASSARVEPEPPAEPEPEAEADVPTEPPTVIAGQPGDPWEIPVAPPTPEEAAASNPEEAAATRPKARRASRGRAAAAAAVTEPPSDEDVAITEDDSTDYDSPVAGNSPMAAF